MCPVVSPPQSEHTLSRCSVWQRLIFWWVVLTSVFLHAGLVACYHLQSFYVVIDPFGVVKFFCTFLCSCYINLMWDLDEQVHEWALTHCLRAPSNLGDSPRNPLRLVFSHFPLVEHWVWALLPCWWVCIFVQLCRSFQICYQGIEWRDLIPRLSPFIHLPMLKRDRVCKGFTSSNCSFVAMVPRVAFELTK